MLERHRTFPKRRHRSDFKLYLLFPEMVATAPRFYPPPSSKSHMKAHGGDAFHQHYLSPGRTPTSAKLLATRFFPSHCHLPSSSVFGMKNEANSGKEGRVNKILQTWVRATLSPNGIYKCFTTHPLTTWHFGGYNHPLFTLCSRSLWDLNESWRILISNPKNPKWW